MILSTMLRRKLHSNGDKSHARFFEGAASRRQAQSSTRVSRTETVKKRIFLLKGCLTGTIPEGRLRTGMPGERLYSQKKELVILCHHPCWL